MIELFSGRIRERRNLVMAMLLALCASARAASLQDEAAVRKPYVHPVALAVEGFNYTNRHIDSFTIDGQGGGNLYVSSRTSGGGGTVCCILYRPGTKVNTLTVRWQSGACYYHVRSTNSDDIYDRYYPFYREAEVAVADDIPPQAKYMEVHFYPDGSVQAAVTGSSSPPRLLLSKERRDKSKYPRCPNDKKPD